MLEWLVANLGDVASAVAIVSFLGSILALVVSGVRSVNAWLAAKRVARFETYHRILQMAASGQDEKGLMKAVDQMAYLSQLARFPEFDAATYRALSYLRADWAARDSKHLAALHEIDLVLAKIRRRRFIAFRLQPDEYRTVYTGPHADRAIRTMTAVGSMEGSINPAVQSSALASDTKSETKMLKPLGSPQNTDIDISKSGSNAI